MIYLNKYQTAIAAFGKEMALFTFVVKVQVRLNPYLQHDGICNQAQLNRSRNFLNPPSHIFFEVWLKLTIPNAVCLYLAGRNPNWI